MDNQIGALSLIIAVILMFAVWVYVSNNSIGPAIEKTGDGFETMVDETFKSTNESNTGPGTKPKGD